MNIFKPFKENKQYIAFAFLFFAGLIIALAILYKVYLINSGYNKPSHLFVLPTLFRYLGFSVIAFLFPWSWKIIKENKRLRIVVVICFSLIFVIGYLFLLALLEWATSEREYSLWKGYLFTLQHSGFLILFLYYLISSLLLVFVIKKDKEIIVREYLNRISYKYKGRTSFVLVEEISMLESNDNYVSIYTNTNQHYLIRNTISMLERQLDPTKFQRIHRKYIVNLSKIESVKVNPSGGYFIYLPNQRRIKMSKSYKEKLKLLTKKT